jgi:hypothetical protein
MAEQRDPRRSFARRPAFGCALMSALLIPGCEADRPPPPTLLFAGLPVSGSVDEALRAGFGSCFNTDAINMRCRRHGVMLYGHGPYEAAVDLRGSNGQSGFDHLTIWHDRDQRALYKILVPLHRMGWSFCYTGNERGGDQAIFTRGNSPVRISMDISRYGDRRLRIFPTWKPQRLSSPCIPSKGLEIFNLDV